MTVKLNDKYMMQAVTPDDVKAMQPQIDAAHKMLLDGSGEGNDFLGWITLPDDYDKEEFARIEKAAEKGALIGAICAAPSILGKRGLLSGKKATCFDGFECFLEGAEVVDEPSVTDGNIITARGAGAAIEFGLQMVAYLKGESADKGKD